MYETALTIHNFLRLAVVVMSAWVVFCSLRGWLSSRTWGGGDRTRLLVLMILVDVQLLVGLLLHLVWSPVTKSAMQDVGAAMHDATLRKWLVEHPVMMIVGIALVHAAKITARKATKDSTRHRQTTIFVGIALVLFVVGSAWPWSAIARPWLRIG
jgi:hypothetical protein